MLMTTCIACALCYGVYEIVVTWQRGNTSLTCCLADVQHSAPSASKRQTLILSH